MAEQEPAAEAAKAPEAKSIVNPKYRDKYKNRHEWLADLLKDKASLTHTIAAKPADGDKPAVPERVIVDGVDVDALFKIARENGLDVDKYENQRGGHGFPGRFRMTVGNMLRHVARQRHGLLIAGEWQEAPSEWLAATGAPTEPTHTRTGERINKPKPAAEAKPAETSKLIKPSEQGAPAPQAATPAPLPQKQAEALKANADKGKSGKKK